MPGMVFQDTIKVALNNKGAKDITDFISSLISDSNITSGICQLFVHSNQNSLIIGETADEQTMNQTADFMAQLAPSDDSVSSDIDKGMDAIPPTMRAALPQVSVSFPVNHGKPVLGTWQGVFLWESCSQPQERRLTITIIGE